MIKINLNEMIKVKLTDHGKDIFYHQFDEINEFVGRVALEPHYPEVDENGYTKFQLWQFIDQYGEHIGVGKKPIIMPFEMIYEEEKQ